MAIEAGTYTCTGDNSVLSNYCTTDTLAIRGGTFINTCEENTGTVYRRCLWTAANTTTTLGRATFTNMYGGQTLCFNGAGIIDGAIISNENGQYGCLASSAGMVEIYDCMLSAQNVLYAASTARIVCRGGLYSGQVPASYLAEGYSCVAMGQQATSAKYPFMVQANNVGIASPQVSSQDATYIYNLNGVRQPSLHRGLNIVVSGGKVQKVFKR